MERKFKRRVVHTTSCEREATEAMEEFFISAAMQVFGVVAEFMADATSEVQDLVLEPHEEKLMEGDEGTPEESLAMALLAKEQQIRQLGQQLQDTTDEERALQEQVADLGGQIESHELQASRRRFKVAVEAVMFENRREKLRQREKAVAMDGRLSMLRQFRLIHVVGFVLVGCMVAFILRSTSRP